MKVLILGAAGFLGINLVDRLIADGIVPTCGRRKRSNVLALRSRKVPMVLTDLDDADTLAEAMAGVDVVFHMAGHYPRLSLDRDAILETGTRQMRNVLDAAAAARVGRLIYASSNASVAPRPDGPSDERDVYPTMPGIGPYHDVKWAMEALAFAEERTEVLVACPSGCLGPWDMRVGTSALIVALANGKDVPHPDGIANLVDVRDVAAALVRLAQHPQPPHRVLLSGSDQPLHALLCDLAMRYGVPQPSAPLSATDARAFADAEELRCSKEGGRPWLSREIADLIINGTPLDTSLAERELGARWTPLPDTLDALDGWARRMRFIPESPAVETSL